MIRDIFKVIKVVFYLLFLLALAVFFVMLMAAPEILTSKVTEDLDLLVWQYIAAMAPLTVLVHVVADELDKTIEGE